MVLEGVIGGGVRRCLLFRGTPSCESAGWGRPVREHRRSVFPEVVSSSGGNFSVSFRFAEDRELEEEVGRELSWGTFLFCALIP